MRLVTSLQAEGKSVLEQKLALLDIKESAVSRSLSEQVQRDELGQETDLKKVIEDNKSQIAKSLDYLRINNEQIDQKSSIRPLDELL